MVDIPRPQAQLISPDIRWDQWQGAKTFAASARMVRKTPHRMVSNAFEIEALE